jgi:hypothetical protein
LGLLEVGGRVWGGGVGGGGGVGWHLVVRFIDGGLVGVLHGWMSQAFVEC